MKINIVGGGPAGLYFALLMKQRNPEHEISVYERNTRDNTFGFGVVFSDRTLSYLGDNDRPTHEAIRSRFQTWPNVDVVHRDQRISVQGNHFSGIARIDLLNILQRRCEELGILLYFGQNIPDPLSLAACDLLVGADGVLSGVREAYEESFGPSLDLRPNKYIWYGTPRLFHGLTLTFRTNQDGLFIAHSYKFSLDPPCSTFIVECDELSWKNARLDQLSDEEVRAYLGEVFREDLQGQPLLSKNSRWLNFGVVRNEHWHHNNVVLLGDALHTVHFSIGSGTKLAFEDAIALAQSFDQHGDNVSAALAVFEAVRRPIVEGFQEASLASLRWFEGAAQYTHLAPLELAWAVMTRSGRVDLDSLRRRDGAFVAAYEALKGKA
ncbi:MAG: FAD-dependent monooxygenase [Deltaproteobacteria bacterium]|nr:FAD-dependent monooxygenase [Deltaproteobacteria bacterium]